ncbi:MAG: PLP-dependent cysteine synthase family protein [Caldilineaceae bacterium]
MALAPIRNRQGTRARRRPQPAARARLPATLLDQIGNTPLLDLTPFARAHGVAPGVELYAKAEWFNPGGSVKARAALAMIEEAEHSGRLRPGQTIIDSSSGNTGIALALIGAVRGYPVQLVMPANVSIERKALVRAYGAQLTESDPLEGSDGAIHLVREIVAAHPARYCFIDQYNNPANWQAHFRTTGPEIWQQTDGAVTHFVAGLGTTGTFVGVGRALKQRNPAIQLVAVQPQDELSVIEGLKHLETAIVPGIYDAALADAHAPMETEATWTTTRALARQAGIFVGPSGGAAVAASLRLAQQLRTAVIVTIIPDDGSKYVSLGIFD